jgi:ubiquitin carboxyl-terminal hydrolase 36/42
VHQGHALFELCSLLLLLIICGYFQVCQVREQDVLKQKAYILFYVRERVRSSVIRKGNGASSLSEKELFSEKIACMNGIIRNALVEKTLDFSLITKVDTKLQMQNLDKGQPSDISAVSQDQCSNEHSNIEDVKASMSQNNAPVQKVPCTLPDGADALSTKDEQITQRVQREIVSPGQPEVCIPDMKTQKLNPDNDQTSNINTTISQDQCSNEHGSTEVTKDLTSQNNELVQKARCTDPDGTATLYSKPEQITPANQMERTSIGQPDACIPCDASSDQKAYEKPLQDVPLESDGALVNSGKDILNSALQLCNGVDGLLGANEQANEPRTYAFCKPTPDSDATTIAQAIPTEVTL